MGILLAITLHHFLILFVPLILLIGAMRFLLPKWLSKGKAKVSAEELAISPEHEFVQLSTGERIFLQYYGDPEAQPIIFIHGWNSYSIQWVFQKCLASKYRLILLDLPGCGKSDAKIDKKYSPKAFADLLDTVMLHLKPAKAILWGHSIGGITIQDFLTRYPEQFSRISAVILQNTTYTNPLETLPWTKVWMALRRVVLVPWAYVIIFLSPVFQVFRWLAYYIGLAHLITRFIFFTGRQSPQQLELTAYVSASIKPGIFARGSIGAFRFCEHTALHSIQIPALILGAACDRLTVYTASKRLAQIFPKAELHRIDQAGHLSLIEQYEEVNRIAEAFINRVNADG